MEISPPVTFTASDGITAHSETITVNAASGKGGYALSPPSGSGVNPMLLLALVLGSGFYLLRNRFRRLFRPAPRPDNQRVPTPRSWLVSLGFVLLAASLVLASTITYAAETTTYYHLDALGSPVAATDEAGNVKWREEYRPYGDKIRNQAAAQANTRWYTGHPHDAATGLTYMGARYYDPVIGRFMGVDAVGVIEGNPHSFNRYAYANNNPYAYIDPDGELAWFIPLIVWVIAEGVNLAIEASGPPPPGCGNDCVVSSGFGIPGGPAARGVKPTLRLLKPRPSGRVAKKPVVIGENMKDRVIPAAKKRGADYYKPRKTKGDPLKKNERWIDDKMREGRKIIDIGPDPRRSKRSPFYEAEKRRIKRRNYPVSK